MSTFRFRSQKATSLRHKIADDIRKAIFGGQLKPGDRLLEVDIAEQMGVSRGPIREAIRMLEQEGLLESQPFKETTVAFITEEEVFQVLIPIRLTIEKFAVKKAHADLQEEHIADLQEIVDEMKEGANRGNLSSVIQSDLDFHKYIVDLAESSTLQNTWTSIYHRIRLHFIHQGLQYDDLKELSASHQTLVDMLQSEEIDSILRRWEEHISEYIKNTD